MIAVIVNMSGYYHDYTPLYLYNVTSSWEVLFQMTWPYNIIYENKL